MENIENKIKICRLCGSSENKFGPHCHQCIKCLSKRRNAKSNEKNYFKTYYQEHKEELKLKQKENYNKSKLNILV
jgi:predicted amidophosphoribosyltransferase